MQNSGAVLLSEHIDPSGCRAGILLRMRRLYDTVGNILTASDGTATHSYTYGDASWKDLLTGFDGQAIIYDAIGNPTSYCNGTRWNFTWVI